MWIDTDTSKCSVLHRRIPQVVPCFPDLASARIGALDRVRPGENLIFKVTFCAHGTAT